ncbi:PQQ-binding-like beta-propeller repeat protein [Microcoleus sp. herbarium19]|uniref:outer membrane protein assembly factor BamB family protein n=1 Tax=unclassified Microcoleus TaxID=2642155 RepID=UPI002FD37454
MSLSSRRTFNQRLGQFLLSAAVPPAVLKQCQAESSNPVLLETNINKVLAKVDPEIELLVPTFLGNDQRRFYGRGVPKSLKLIDKFQLGSGRTFLGRKSVVWSGAGWTGQPTITRDRGKTYLIIGAYDHNLRKIDLATNKEVWRYEFDDIIKGSSTIYIDEKASAENRIVVLQGSRSGGGGKNVVPSFRAISFRTGKELWKLDIRRTPSYSQDNDSSALYLGNGLLFNAGENAIGYFLNSSASKAKTKQGIKQPEILSEIQLYAAADIGKHGGNLVAESSPSRFKDRIFIAAGSGHIYGIDLKTKKIVWDFYTGSDLDGSAVISKSGRLFCAIEKQYIQGSGGVLKLNPNKEPNASVEWFLPTGNRRLSGWEGGIIGSVALNDEYNSGEFPAIFATNAIDGNLYIGSQGVITGKKVFVPWQNQSYHTPVIVFKKEIGSSISTPIFTDGNKLISAGYNGVYLFDLIWERAKSGEKNALQNAKGEFYRLKVKESGRFKPGLSFEATPVVWDGIVRICARDGWMYTLG